MPSLWSAAADDPESTCFGSASLEASISVIALSLLPPAPLQAEPGNQNSAQQKWNHGGRDRGPFAELAAQNRAPIRQRRHQLRQQRIGDLTENLPAAGAVDGRGFIERQRHGLQPGQQRDGDEGYPAPDIREDHRPTRIPNIAE